MLTNITQVQLCLPRYRPPVEDLEDSPDRLGGGVIVIFLVDREDLDDDVLALVDLGDTVCKRTAAVYRDTEWPR